MITEPSIRETIVTAFVLGEYVGAEDIEFELEFEAPQDTPIDPALQLLEQV